MKGGMSVIEGEKRRLPFAVRKRRIWKREHEELHLWGSRKL